MGKDLSRLNAIIRYCSKIQESIEEFGEDEEDFLENSFHQYACSFCILQIGENIDNMSPELKQKYSEINWDDIVQVRVSIAHGYENIDFDLVWKTITKKIPKLKKTCEKILRENKKL